MEIIVKCKYCNSDIKRDKRVQRKKELKGYKNNYCSNKCQGQFKREERRKEILEKGSKKCSICQQEFKLTDFNKNKGTPSGYNRVCRNCSNKRSKQYYDENPDKHKKNVAKRNKKVRIEFSTKVLRYLKTNPCIDCGETRFATLQFDHRDDVFKFDNVSTMIGRQSNWNKIKKEIDKCDVRCANCHSIRTSKQQSWYKNIDLDNL